MAGRRATNRDFPEPLEQGRRPRLSRGATRAVIAAPADFRGPHGAMESTHLRMMPIDHEGRRVRFENAARAGGTIWNMVDEEFGATNPRQIAQSFAAQGVPLSGLRGSLPEWNLIDEVAQHLLLAKRTPTPTMVGGNADLQSYAKKTPI